MLEEIKQLMRYLHENELKILQEWIDERIELLTKAKKPEDSTVQ